MTASVPTTHPHVDASGPGETRLAKKSATRIMASALGAFVGLAGVEHGVGEVLQGNVAPGGTFILSWPGSALFRVVGGEPAMTIVPNLLVTGILSILVGLTVMIWATVFIGRKHGGLILMLLLVGQLLVGGGIAPIPLGIIAGAAATRISAPLSWWRAHLPVRAQRFLATLWAGSFTICVASWLLLFPGLIVIGYFLGVSGSEPMIPTLILAVISSGFGFLLLTIVAGFAHDLESRRKGQHGERGRPSAAWAP